MTSDVHVIQSLEVLTSSHHHNCIQCWHWHLIELV